MTATTRLANTAHPRFTGAVRAGALRATDEITVTVLLRENEDTPLSVEEVLDDLAAKPLAARHHYSRAQFARTHGAHRADILKVKKFAREYGLQPVATNPGARTVKLKGTVAQMQAAFGVQLVQYSYAQNGHLKKFHSHDGELSVPDYLGTTSLGESQPVVAGVFGLDNRPIATPRFVRPSAASPRARSYDPQQVAAAYNYPTIDCTGLTIGIIELGGTVSDADVTAYFSARGLPKPVIKHVSVDGAVATSDPMGADVEVALDVEVIGAMAPGCTIIIYDAPNTEQGFIDAVLAAANDSVNKPVSVSISWGAPENEWSAGGMDGMDHAFAQAAAMGVVCTAAAGDNGSADGVGDGKAHADHPASSPHVFACGGTNLQLNGTTITSETVWGGPAASGATGGGVSDHFGSPDYQVNNGILSASANDGHIGRGLPDGAGNADPATGYNITSGGQTFPVGGTSAVAPQWAAGFAIMSRILGRTLGDVHGIFYSAAKTPGSMHDITAGTNGQYNAGSGFDLCTGWGSPDLTALTSALIAASPTPAPPAPTPTPGPTPPVPPAPAQPAPDCPPVGPTVVINNHKGGVIVIGG